MDVYPEVTGAILAGGRSSRMKGTDKGLIRLQDTPLIQYVIDAVKPQTAAILINANRHITEYKKFGYPVIDDGLSDSPGPLAGIAACMKQASTEYVLCVPCDSPLVPEDLVARLYGALNHQDAEIAMVHDGTRTQPLFSLIQSRLADSIYRMLDAGENKVESWYRQHEMVECDFSDQQDRFLNINTQQDLQGASFMIDRQ